nr:hypothetical protein [Tanacetum cinerariifolium]
MGSKSDALTVKVLVTTKQAQNCRGRGFKYGDRGAMCAESGSRGQMGAESGGREEEEVMAGKLWVVQELEEVEQEEEEVVADEEEDVVEEDPLLMDRDDIKKSMEDEHMQGLLVEQEDLRQKQEKEHQDKLDEKALQQARGEDLMFERMDLEREEQQWEAMMDPLNDCRFPDEEESMDVEMYKITNASINFIVTTYESVTHDQPSSEWSYKCSTCLI